MVASLQQAHAQNLCDRVSQIKHVPHKDEPVDDAAYNAFIKAGRAALPCLIAKVTDTRKMRDPRSAPGYAGIETRVGDVAYFVLTDIAKIDPVEMLPLEVRKYHKAEGILVYFRFVQKKRNRRWLQHRLETWYRSS